jgi:hypothetical protein
MTDEKNQKGHNPIDPINALESVMKRSVDGKVGVVERGSEAKVMSADGEAAAGAEPDKGNGAAHPQEPTAPPEPGVLATPEAPSAPQSVPLDEDDAQQIREALQSMRNFEGQIASIRIQYREQEDKLIEQRKTAQTELNATIKSIAKRNKVDEGWLVNLDLMQFEPPKRPPFHMMPRR